MSKNKVIILIFAVITVIALAVIFIVIRGGGKDELVSGDFVYALQRDGNEAVLVRYTGSGGRVNIPDSIAGHPITAVQGNPFLRTDSDGNSIAALECDIRVSAGHPYLAVKDGLLYGKTDGRLIYCSPLRSGKVTIPEQITSIGQAAFLGSRISGVTFPDGLHSIGYEAFRGCKGLTDVSIPESVSNISDCAFLDCSGLKSVTIPKEVSTGEHAFDLSDGKGYRAIPGLTVYQRSEILPEGLLWKDNGDGTATVTGYTGSESTLEIPGNIEGRKTAAIGEYAFKDCTGLTAVTIPAGVVSIGSQAFSGCSGLTGITIPKGVTSIGDQAFNGCGSLTGITIPEGVMSIGNQAFWDCDRLTEITIPDGVTVIGNQAFRDCGRLTDVSIPGSVTSFGNNVFDGCGSLAGVTIRKGITRIWDNAFEGCGSLRSVTIPEGVTEIGSFAFYGCGGLTGVTIPESVTVIGDYAFKGCQGLTAVTIPAGVTRIGLSAFEDCTGLTDVMIRHGATTIGNYAFKGCSSLRSLTIPDSVTSIGSYAFDACESLTDVNIPNGVTSISSCAFSDCSSLRSLTIPDSVTDIGNFAFYNCSSLPAIVIPVGVTGIGDYAFYGCSGLTAVTIPFGVQTIGEYAFSDCTGLTGVTIRYGVTTIGNYAFSGCSSLRSLTIPDSVTIIGSYAFSECESLTDVIIPSSITEVGDYAFYRCKQLARVTLGDGLVSIGDRAFNSCTELADLNIPNSVTSIGKSAFYACNMTDVTIPACTTSIGDGVFSACPRINIHVASGNPAYKCVDGVLFTMDGKRLVQYPRSMTDSFYAIPEGVTTIGDFAFTGCRSLTSISIPEGVTSIGQGAFAWCSGLTSVDLPHSLETIGKTNNSFRGAFESCTGLTRVTIPTGVTTIGNYAFKDCTGLTYASLPEGATVGVHAFEMYKDDEYTAIPGLTIVYVDRMEIEESVESPGYEAEASVEAAWDYEAVESVEAAWDYEAVESVESVEEYETIEAVETADEESHDWKAATCTEPRTCMNCGATEGTALGHDWKDATCTSRKVCLRCGTTEGSVLGHKWMPATCTEPHTCERCGMTYGTALGHDWKAATCTEPKTCKYCGATEGKALGHDWKAATCSEPKTCMRCGITAGVQLRHNWKKATCTEPETCRRCGLTQGTALGHAWREATCTTPKTCTRCGLTEGEALGHDWKAATCTEPKTCTRCGLTEGKALGHYWKAATCTEPKTCTRCGITAGVQLRHNWKKATCTEPKTCRRCGLTQGTALGHAWREATCTTPKTCARCGITEGKALGHDWKAATCTEPKTCTRCGLTEGKALGHDWKAATCSEPKTCTRCGITAGVQLRHNWKKATCTEPETCRRCGLTQGTALGHNWKDATATEPKTCLRCGATEVGELSGKTIILHSNDVHGAVEGYAYMAALKAEYEAKGAKVIVVDAGDYSQGTIYVSTSKGATAVELMNTAGYDLATLGNHEFDYGYAQLKDNLANAAFDVICADVTLDETGETIYPATKVFDGDVKIGFFGMETPETATKVNPGLISEISFETFDDLYASAQEAIDSLRGEADIVIGLVHLGVDEESAANGYRSVDLYANVNGVDFLIDGHSHTVMTAGENGEPIQSTGTALAYIGVIVIDNETKAIEDNYLIKTKPLAEGETLPEGVKIIGGETELPKDMAVAAMAAQIMEVVDADYRSTFAVTEIRLNGERAPGNRTEETNLGDLITDAMVWSVVKEGGIENAEPNAVVGITNGGGIRATIEAGEVSKKDINTVLPFGNTVAVVYVKGSELLEVLEASTYCTPDAIGGYPQTSDIDWTLNTAKAYDQGELYVVNGKETTYYAPASIQRVTINSVNGEAFDQEATYAVVTNNFCAAGGDTYAAFYRAYEEGSGFDTGIPMDEAVMAYISEVLGGKITAEQYGAPRGSQKQVYEVEEAPAEEVVVEVKGVPVEEAVVEEEAAEVETEEMPVEEAAEVEEIHDAEMAEAMKDLLREVTEIGKAAAEAEESGADGLKLQNNADGTVTITGYTGTAASLTLPDSVGGRTVTGIADFAFLGCDSLTGVTIPAGVTAIGSNPFAECYQLTAIDVSPANPVYASIDGVLFHREEHQLVAYPAGKTGERYVIPEKITGIGDAAFYRCGNLTAVSLPSSVAFIGQAAFADCDHLRALEVAGPNPVFASIDGVLFAKEGRALVAYPAGKDATRYTVPRQITRIESFAFFGADRLIDVTVPDSVTYIGPSAFGRHAPNLVITCGAGSAAQTYCEEGGILCQVTEE